MSGASGDPQFTGFLGQSYQVHGTASTVYSIISSERLQFNALFTFLTAGQCRQGTECFAHPGNYFGSVGLLIKAEDGSVVKVAVKSGSVTDGMKVTIDGEPLTPSSNRVVIDSVNSLHLTNKFELLVSTRDYTIRLENSDMFINQQVSIQSHLAEAIKAVKSSSDSLAAAAATATAAQSLPHGILGQTWRMMTYSNRWKFIEGDLMDYVISDESTASGHESIMSTPAMHNRFNM